MLDISLYVFAVLADGGYGHRNFCSNFEFPKDAVLSQCMDGFI